MKRLRSATIIESDLYVQRDADRQLRRGLEDMGRPSYVLVARQMGKTNLLLNARRQLETSDDAFVYIDLSNPFESLRGCLRNIIEMAIESKGLLFAPIAQAIQTARTTEVAPHKEHERELRLLLSRISGKLVLILDEIDALTSATYSDQFFALIRSVYFARASFAEYSRLTYVLSGVAEPTDLIKNPKLSPFNIGEKIYLDDFSFDEVLRFVDLAHLDFHPSVVRQLYSWVGGNPRMTWDVCSDLEDRQLAGQALTTEVVDESVRKLYLSSFDRPPIDHIRTLTESNAEIRSALVELRYGKGALISDAQKSRLYLAGICNSNRESPRIKSRVIEESLSEAWIASIERSKLGLLKSGLEQLESGRYVEAVQSLKDFLAEQNTDPIDRRQAAQNLAQAQYFTGDYREAVRLIDENLFDVNHHPTDYYNQRNIQALSYFHLRDFKKSAELFAEGEKDPRPTHRIEARVNLVLSRQYGKAAPAEELIDETLRIIADLSVDAHLSNRNAVLVVVRNALATQYVSAGRKEAAIAQFDEALKIATRSESVILAIALAPHVEKLRQTELIDSAARITISDKLMPVGNSDGSHIVFSDSTLGRLLGAAFESDAQSLFMELLHYCVDENRPWVEPTLSHFVAGVAGRDRASHVRFWEFVRSRSAEIPQEAVMALIRNGGYLDVKGFDATHSVLYTSILNQKARSLDAKDVGVLGLSVKFFLEQNRLQEAHETMESLVLHRTETFPARLVIIDYYRMIVAGLRGVYDLEARIADSILQTLASKDELSLLADDRRTIERAARAARRREPPLRASLNLERRYGRNEKVTVRYPDGRTQLAKFKTVEDDLRSGRCQLVKDGG